MIIAQLARTGEWEGTRSGHPIRLLRFRANGGPRIEYSVRVRLAWISGAAETVGAALDELNEIILDAAARRASKVLRFPAPAEDPASLWQ